MRVRMIRDSMSATENRTHTLRFCSGEQSLHEERRLHLMPLEQIENRLGVFRGAVVDGQPDFLRLRGKARDDGTEPLHVRTQGRVEDQGVREREDADARERRVWPERDRGQRRQEGEGKDQFADATPPYPASSSDTRPRSRNMATAAVRFSAIPKKYCQAMKRVHAG